MITYRMPVVRAHALVTHRFFWLGSLTFALACSGAKTTDFFDSDGETGGSSSGGSSSGGMAGSTAGSSSGGTTIGGTSSGGASGNANGGNAGDPSGGTGAETGGTSAEGGTSAGGTEQGGTGQGGDSGTGATGGTAGDPQGGSSGAGMGATGGMGMGGTDMGGAGMGGAGMGGAGMGGAGKSGAAGMAGTAGKGGCVPTMPQTERCDGIDNNCSGAIDEGTACPDNCSGATLGGHTYLLCSFEKASGSGTRERSFTQAETFCTTRSLDLVSIDSSDENRLIVAWITQLELQQAVWMGANDRDATLGNSEGTWVWGSSFNAVQFWDGGVNGDPVGNRYNDWAEDQPDDDGNEDCGVLSADHDFHWADVACSDEYPNFVCESTTTF
jgi:hypothetical protein